MTHDSLCPWGQAFGHLEPWEPHHYCCQDCNPGMTNPDTVTCQCKLIAKVRSDEREAFEIELRNGTFGFEIDLIDPEAIAFLTEYVKHE